jgi:hypothetical protein
MAAPRTWNWFALRKLRPNRTARGDPPLRIYCETAAHLAKTARHGRGVKCLDELIDG